MSVLLFSKLSNLYKDVKIGPSVKDTLFFSIYNFDNIELFIIVTCLQVYICSFSCFVLIESDIKDQ